MVKSIDCMELWYKLGGKENKRNGWSQGVEMGSTQLLIFIGAIFPHACMIPP